MDLLSRWLKNYSITVSVDAGLGEICSFHSSLLITTTGVFLVSPHLFEKLNMVCMGLRASLSSQRCCCSMQGSSTRWHLKAQSNLDRSMDLYTLGHHNLFLFIFSTCFVNVILPSCLRILPVTAVDVQLVPPVLSSGSTGQDVTHPDWFVCATAHFQISNMATIWTLGKNSIIIWPLKKKICDMPLSFLRILSDNYFE